MRYRQTRFAGPDYIPKIRGYARVSHKNQHDKGNSIQDQEARIKAYIEMRQVDGVFGNAVWDRMYLEPHAQSAYSRPFMNRPMGAKLWEILQPSDHLIIDKLDRMFRSTYDFCVCEKFFGERGIRLHFANGGFNMTGVAFDTGTSGGDFIVKLLAMLAEGESDRISERVSTARRMLRARGKHQGTNIPFFCELQGAKKGATLGSGGVMVFKDWALETLERVSREVDEFGSLSKVGHEWAYAFLKDKGLLPPETTPQNHRNKIRKMYRFYKAWNAIGRPDINTIKIGDMIRDYLIKNPGSR